MKKKFKVITLCLTLCLAAFLTISGVRAATSYYSSTLSLPYGTWFSGASRNFAAGTYKFDVSVDGFNKSDGTVRRSGSSRMMVELGDVATGRYLKTNDSTYTYGTCVIKNMGSYDAGYRYYTFLSQIYNSSTDGYDKYDGVKSSSFKMYPKP